MVPNAYLKQRQYVDDCLACVSTPYEFRRYLYHLDTFCAASGMEANFEKTHGLLLGTWRTSPPLELLPSEKYPIKWIHDATPIKHLGIIVGNDIPHHMTVHKAMEKVRDAAAKMHPERLTITGRILLANACLTSIMIASLTHTWASADQMKALQGILNTIVNNRVTSSFCTWKEKKSS